MISSNTQYISSDDALQKYLETLKLHPDTINFEETLSIIDRYYNFEPGSFKNGNLFNQAGENNGSCKLFAFAKCQGLTEAQTLKCFGQYYQQDVLQNPHGTDHQNIRNFIKTGWDSLKFEAEPLTPKSSV